MKDVRETWYDAANRVSVMIVDVTTAAQDLARGHLSGPTSAYFLTKALAAAALLGSEMSERDEVLSVQMKCTGPLGGFNVECSAAGTLRGYTEKKILDDFDGMGTSDEKKVVGERQIQIARSVPGRILSQGIATTLTGYLADSLQRKARIFLEAAVSDEVEILEARGLMVEILPDSPVKASVESLPTLKSLSTSSRTLLKKLGFDRAELKKSEPLSFACTCSRERAAAMLNALGEEERKNIPSAIDITCHMCGRTFTIPTATGVPCGHQL